ncbi:MAG: DNA repair protein [Flavobacteriales bacterium]|nr:DNA repair protein [Flavobacteriales bacterium]
MKTVNITTIQFPEIQLSPRDAHKLRGYFGNIFKEQSPLLHNHYETGVLRYKYPLVQYKVLGNTPTLVALEEGADLLTALFLKIKEIQIDGKNYPVTNKNITAKKVDIGVDEELFSYEFSTLWMALNQDNHKRFKAASKADQKKMLQKILIGNILSVYKNLELFLNPEQRILATLSTESHHTNFKDQKMLAFTGAFTTNALLPDKIGLGKSVSRGFGSIIKRN